MHSCELIPLNYLPPKYIVISLGFFGTDDCYIIMRDAWPAPLSKGDATELPGKPAVESEAEIKYFRAFSQTTGKKTIIFSCLSF